MVLKKSQLFALGFSLIASLSLEQGQASDFHSPRSLALGGSGHAGPILNDAIYLNPSYAPFLKTYSVSASYLSFNDTHQSNPGRAYGISIHDGRTKLFQAGLGYSVRESGALFTVGASKSFLERFGFGMGAKMFFPNTQAETSFQDISLSSTFVAANWLHFALIADNLIQSDTALRRGMAREIVLGSKINFEGIFVLYLDPHYAPTVDPSERWGYEMGAEWGIMSDLYLRAGLFSNSQIPYQEQRGGGFGFGAGWMAPKLSLDYGFSRVLATSTNAPTSNIHTFGATVYF